MRYTAVDAAATGRIATAATRSTSAPLRAVGPTRTSAGAVAVGIRESDRHAEPPGDVRRERALDVLRRRSALLDVTCFERVRCGVDLLDQSPTDLVSQQRPQRGRD